MPAPGAKVNTMAEGLSKLMRQIAELKLTEDADIDFLTDLETGLLAYVKGQIGGGAQPQPGMAPGGAGMPPGGAGPMPVSMAGPGAGVRMAPALPPVDELRRMLTGGGP